jgi:hypothetical protein
MTHLRQTGRAEAELAQALSAADRRDDVARNDRQCPSGAVLRRFVAGKCRDDQIDVLLAHVGTCERCIQVLSKIRIRRQIIRRAYVSLAAAACLLILIWFSLARRSSTPAGIATADLRSISPTRGTTHQSEVAAELGRNADGLRVILPIGSEGKYEYQLQVTPENRPVARGSGETSLDNHDVVLNLPIKFSELSARRYLLALRRNDSEWVYYPLTVR